MTGTTGRTEESRNRCRGGTGSGVVREGPQLQVESNRFFLSFIETSQLSPTAEPALFSLLLEKALLLHEPTKQEHTKVRECADSIAVTDISCSEF